MIIHERIVRILTFLALAAPQIAYSQRGSAPLPAGSNSKSETAKPSGRDIVIAIGIDEYQDPFWGKLKYATNDAKLFAEIVGQDNGRDKVKKVLSGETATLNQIRQTLERTAAMVMPSDNLIVYISAHGSLALTPNRDFEQVIATFDTRSDNLRSTALSHTELRQLVDKFSARRKLLILATCHSGIGKSRLTADTASFFAGIKGDVREHLSGETFANVSEGIMVLAASGKNETAREDDSLQGDIYTHYLLNGLKKRSADSNADGAISAAEAHEFASEKTWAYSRGKQRPTIEVKAIGDADIWLAGKPSKLGLPILQAYDKSWSGLLVQADKGPKKPLPSQVTLREGTSTIAIFHADSARPIAKYQVVSEPGTNMSIDEITAPPPLRLGLGIDNSKWLDTKFERITNQTAIQTPFVVIGFEQRNFGIDFKTSAPNKTESTPAAGINAKTTWTMSSLTGRWIRRHLTGWEWGLGGGATYERLRIELSDAVSDAGGIEPVIWEKSKMLPMIETSGGYNWQMVRIEASLIYVQGALPLKNGPQIRADKLSVGAGLSWLLGGRARRLP